uniref:Ig-like domain-containing protein n=1 Tax=Amphimedon queenslandica TaxID=400682 RepID=A0A1X7SUU4_AMPQE
ATIIPLPAATIFLSGSVVPIVDQSFNLNCTGTGTLRWYRGFNLDTPLDRYTQLIDSINNTLSLMITLSDDESGQTDERSRTYFCTANNSLGVARSQSVLIP